MALINFSLPIIPSFAKTVPDKLIDVKLWDGSITQQLLFLPDIKILSNFFKGELGIADGIMKKMILGNLPKIKTPEVLETFLGFAGAKLPNSFKSYFKDGKLSINPADLTLGPMPGSLGGLKALEKSLIQSIFETKKPYIEIIKLVLENLVKIEDIIARVLAVSGSSMRPKNNPKALGYSGNTGFLEKLAELESFAKAKSEPKPLTTEEDSTPEQFTEQPEGSVTQSIVFSTGTFDNNSEYTYIYEYLKSAPELGVGSASISPLTDDNHLPEYVVFAVFDSSWNQVDDRLISSTVDEAKVDGTAFKNLNWINRSGKWFREFEQIEDGKDYDFIKNNSGNKTFYNNDGPSVDVDSETKFLKKGLPKIKLRDSLNTLYSDYYLEETTRRATKKGLSVSQVQEVADEISTKIGTKDSTGSSGIQTTVEGAVKNSFLNSTSPSNTNGLVSGFERIQNPLKPKKITFKGEQVWIDAEAKYDMKIIKCDSSTDITFLDIEPDNRKLKTTKILRFVKNTLSVRLDDSSEFYYEFENSDNLPFPRFGRTVEISIDNTRGGGIFGAPSFKPPIRGNLNIYRKFMDPQFSNGIIFSFRNKNLRLYRFLDTWKIEEIYWSINSSTREGDIIGIGVGNLPTELDGFNVRRVKVTFPNNMDYYFTTFDGQFMYRKIYSNVSISSIQPENLQKVEIVVSNLTATRTVSVLPANSLRVEDDRFKFGKLISNTQITNDKLAEPKPFSTDSYGTPVTIKEPSGALKNLSKQKVGQIYRFQQTEDDTETYFIIEGILSEKNKQKLKSSAETSQSGGGDYSFPSVIGVIPVFIEMLIDVFAKLIPNITSLINLISNPAKFITDIIIAKIGDNNGTEPEKFGIFGKKFINDLKKLGSNMVSEKSKASADAIGNTLKSLQSSLGNVTSGLLQNSFSGIGDIAGNFAGSVQSALGSSLSGFQNQFGSVVNNLQGQFGNLPSQLGGLLPGVSSAFTNIPGQLSKGLSGLSTNTFGNIQGQFGNILSGGVDSLQGQVGNLLSGSLSSLQGQFGNLTSNLSGNFGAQFNNLLSGGLNSLQGQFGNLTSNLSGNPSSINGLLGSITGNSFLSIGDKLKSLTGGVNNIQGSILNLPNIANLAQSSIGNLVSNFSGTFKGISVVSNLNPPSIDSLIKTFNLPVGSLNNIGESLAGFGNFFNSAQTLALNRFSEVRNLAIRQLSSLSKLSSAISGNIEQELEKKKTQIRNKLKDFVKKSKLNNYVYITPEGFPYFMLDGVSTIKLFGDAPMLKKLPSISFGLETKLTNLALGGMAAPEFNLNTLGKVNKASELFSQLTGTSKAIGQTVNNAINNLKKNPIDAVSNLTNTVGNIKSLLPFNLIFQHFEPSTDKTIPELSGLTKIKKQKSPSKFVNFNFESILDIPSEILDKSDSSNFVYQPVDIQYRDGKKEEGIDYKYVYVEENTQQRILEAQKLDEAGETPKAIALLEEISKISKNNSILNNLLAELKKKVLSSVQPIVKFMLEIVSTPLKVVVGIITYIMDLFKSFLNPFELVVKIIDFVSFKWMLDFFNPTSKNSIFSILGMKFNIEKYLTEFIPKLTSQLSIFKNLSSVSSKLIQNFVSTFTGSLSGLFNNLQTKFGNGFDIESQISNLTNQFQGIFNNLQGSFGNLGSNLSGTLDGLQGQFGSVFKNLQSQFSTVSSNLVSSLPGVINNLTGQFSNISSNLSGTIGSLQGNITTALSGVSTNFTEVANNFTGQFDNFSGQSGNMIDGLKSQFGNILDGAGNLNLQGQIGNLSTDLFSNLSGTFNNLSGEFTSVVSNLNGTFPNFGNLFDDLKPNIPITFDNLNTGASDLSKLKNGVNSIQSSILNFSNFPNTAQSALSNLTLNASGIFNNISVVSNLNPPSIESLSRAFNIDTNAFQNIIGSGQGAFNNLTSSLSGSFGQVKSFVGRTTGGLTKNLSAAQISLGKLSNNLSLSLGKTFDFSKVSLDKFGSKFDLSEIIDMPFFTGKFPTYSLKQFETLHSFSSGISLPGMPSVPKMPSFPVKSLSSILCLIESIINSVIDLIWGILGLGSLIPTPHLKICRDSNQGLEMSDIAKLLRGDFDDPSKETDGPSYNFAFNIVSSDGREVRNLNREELDKWLQENRDIQIV